MRVIDIVKDINYSDLIGNPQNEVTGITSNSKQVQNGYLFCAIRGDNVDGHDFIQNAINSGASSILLEDVPEDLSENITYIKVDNTREDTAYIASNYYLNPSNDLTLAGVTGTNGKTTITYIVDAIWREENKSTGIIGTIENRYAGKTIDSSMTTPDSIELTKLLFDMKGCGVSAVCMEVSSHALDKNRVDGCHFDCTVFTNLTQDHLDYHTSIENYFSSKKKLFTKILKNSSKKNKFAVINIDDDYGKSIYMELGDNAVSYSVLSNDADIWAENYKITQEGIRADIITSEGKLNLRSNLIGLHNLYNLLASVSLTLKLGTPMSAIESAVSKNIIIPGRLEKIENNLGYEVLVDYAHTPDALKNVLNALIPLKKNNIITVFGCGGDRDRDKRPLMGQIAAQLSDYVIITSDNPRSEDPEKIIDEIENGTKSLSSPNNNYITIVDRENAIKKSIEIAGKNDIVLIAGKGHEDYQIIGNKRLDFDDREIVRKYLGN
ncbi:MAG: UDP-N-acetylmuramoyl-L-alanyl-D-glutamate--2,6-diaminopimelate ligase [Thermodesulfobacteriota bacterium]